MRQEKKVIEMTAEGKAELESEIENLRMNRRKEVAQKIKEAREQGDLSENAEYDAALEEQSEIERRIGEIEEILKYAVVVSSEGVSKDTVTLGSTVVLYDEEYEEELEYKIVGSAEADLDNNKLSQESPVGRALMGRKEGEVITAATPSGDLKFKILSVNKDKTEKK